MLRGEKCNHLLPTSYADSDAALNAVPICLQGLNMRTDLLLCVQQDRSLRELVRCLQHAPAETQWAAATTLVILLVDDPSTHWVLTQVPFLCTIQSSCLC